MTVFCDGDEVKVNLDIEKFYFGGFSGSDGGDNLPNHKKFFKKTTGTIIEHDFVKKLKQNSYLVQFGENPLKSYWFLGEELILI